MTADALHGGGNRIPRPLTSFVGREPDLAELRRLSAGSRLLTLTGPGGSGKTRLAIELAARVLGDFRDGGCFVALAAVRDPELVASSIAQQLGLQDSRELPLLEHLAGYLRERELLLVLDNFEQVLDAAPAVAGLLAATAKLRIVVTSRAPLRVSGEQEFPVAPMGVPPRGTDVSPSAVAATESAQLFAARAAAVEPRFTLDDDNAPAVARIVQRLDGLPLAIELAAARVKLLPPEAIVSRLEQSLSLLVGGGRDMPDRQQTLRGTIAWSYGLLSEGASRLMAGCSAFRGGMAMPVVETVCAAAVDLGLPVLDAMQELVDHSLLRQDPAHGGPRYAMLETVRQFAAERLAELPGSEGVHAAHASAFAAMAAGVERAPCWPDKHGLDQLALEHDNFRAAIDWLRVADPSAALRLAGNLTAFWSARGHFIEGRRRLAELLDLVPEQTRERVVALNGAGWLAGDQGDRRAAYGLLDASLELARSLGDRVGEGTALLYRGRAKLGAGQVAEGGRDISGALAVLTEAGDEPGAAAALFYTGVAARDAGELAAACEVLTRSAQRSAELGLPALELRAVHVLGIASVGLGDLSAARTALRRAVPALVELGDRFSILAGLYGLSGLAAESGKPRLALRLAGAAANYGEVHQVSAPMALLDNVDQWLKPARTAVGSAASRLLADGRAMTLDEAVARALADEPDDRWPVQAGSMLTRRESEVATLVVRGLSNGEIASQLFLSVRTVEAHVARIFDKLGVHTRGQLAAMAHEQGLLP
jgi:predicted ATPase/DNA-binding CsgD family transcriptional regulator